ncbi:MAG TPA: RnfABCDGE type electron transport complex subunit B [Candidatus Brocadiia bacterium]|nr:RnfABCDGE type electron transport complex subunit B [Planctomycetota bacterium]MDO8094780.1 RnfABCDGE type electron transport complex subunit B [Candidatus Brocadiales bacterium]
MSIIIGTFITMGVLGIAFGLGLAIVSDRFAVKIDPRVEKIIEVLPGANCGACGLAGCSDFAKAVAEGRAPVSGCTVGQEDVARLIANIMGVVAEAKEKSVAVVMCRAKNVVDKFAYEGVSDCRAAALLHGGPKGCEYGCIGLGTCVEACMFEAMRMGSDGVPEIIEERCTACGKCAAVCPKALISILPISKKVHVRCKSLDKGAVAKKKCGNPCIACKLCEKECPYDAIHVQNFLAVIDYDKCTSCGKCVLVCPTKIIENYEGKRVVVVSASPFKKVKQEDVILSVSKES